MTLLYLILRKKDSIDLMILTFFLYVWNLLRYSHSATNSLHPWTLLISLACSGLAYVSFLPFYLSTMFLKLTVWQTHNIAMEDNKGNRADSNKYEWRGQKSVSIFSIYSATLALFHLSFVLCSPLLAIKFLNILSHSLCLSLLQAWVMRNEQ